MEFLPSPSPAALAKEAREALSRRPPQSSREYFIDLVRSGFINARGQVTRLIGGSAEPEPHRETWTPERPSKNGKPKK